MHTDSESPPLVASSQIQGNILEPFGTDHQAFVALCFCNDRDGARRWLREAAERVSFTAEVVERRGDSDAEVSWLNVGLTATGLVTLQPGVAADLVGFEAFWSGPLGSRIDESGRLTTTPPLLGDADAAAPKNWLIGGPDGPPVDALLTLGARDSTALEQLVYR